MMPIGLTTIVHLAVIIIKESSNLISNTYTAVKNIESVALKVTSLIIIFFVLLIIVGVVSFWLMSSIFSETSNYKVFQRYVQQDDALVKNQEQAKNETPERVPSP